MLNGVIMPPPGRYIIAVSGGVDSAALLDVVAKNKKLKLMVAHYDHAMRPDSGKDEKLVGKLAERYGLKFVSGRSKPGMLKSEDDARKARYRFFEKKRRQHKARAIITAHHQDDLIETALINVLRGTNRKGLSAISSNPKVIRPFLDVPKREILKYAKKQKLAWTEDPTNMQNKYLRNNLRNEILAGLTDRQRSDLVNNLQKVAKINKEADDIIATISHILIINNSINRRDFANLPLKVGDEVLAGWLRSNKYSDFDRDSLRRISTAIKTARPGIMHAINNRLKLVLTESAATIAPTDETA